MFYYEEEGLCLRDMKSSDINKLFEAFAAQDGMYRRPITVFEGFFQEQSVGKRIAVIAEKDGEPVGYASLLPTPWEGPLMGHDIPEIVDFNVLRKFQRQGIGWKILDVLEELAARTNSRVTLSVGVYESFGTAQRMYAKRGYIPDGTGLWYYGKQVLLGNKIVCNDALVTFMIKQLKK